MPARLYEMLVKVNLRITRNTIQNPKDKKGIHVSISRKAHLAILSSVMQQHEIDLLQGRVSNVTVRHYVKHLREIADKYAKAYEPYMNILDSLLSPQS